MNTSPYKVSNRTLLLMIMGSIVTSFVFKWSYHNGQVNFMGGDARDYYSSLVSVFISHDLQQQAGDEWYLLKTDSGIVNVHPVGVSLLLLPFFLLSFFAASVFGFPTDGFSLPFQIGVGIAALLYAALGLNYLKKLLILDGVKDRTIALILLLTFFGTNLLHYTLSEAGMSHVYSFFLIAAFLYQSKRFVLFGVNRDLIKSLAWLGLIVLVRPNNVFIVLALLSFFNNLSALKEFFAGLFRKKSFYIGLLICLAIVSLQSLVWYHQTGSFFQNTYKRDGFYWLHPQLWAMLFGADGGFFIYTPVCLLLMAGLVVLFRQNKFSFFAASGFLLFLFYFFSSYWGYTYFDGLGIRVLVDYYSFFALIGSRLFTYAESRFSLQMSLTGLAFVFLFINLVYIYQANRGIILRSGMSWRQWKYVFLKTSPSYQNVLGGSHELKPYSSQRQPLVLDSTLALGRGNDFSGKDFGPAISFERLGFDSNRIRVLLQCKRRELEKDGSRDAQLCIAVEDAASKVNKAYVQFKLNETPARDCCDSVEYHYAANVVGDFDADDRLAIYVWNINKGNFVLEKLKAEVYNYNYNLN